MIESPFEKQQFVSLDKPYLDLDIYQKEDVAVIAMNKFKADKRVARQAANHLDGGLIGELIDAFKACESDPSIRSIILASAQRFAFCRGAKIEVLHGATEEECGTFIDEAQNLILVMQRLQKPIICANSGLTLGGGLEITLACDYRIASDREIVIFGFPEASLGIIPGMAGTQNAARLMGTKQAKDIIANVKLDITAEEALKTGLIDMVVPAQDLFSECYNFAKKDNLKKTFDGANGTHSITREQILDEIKTFLDETKVKVVPGDRTAPLSRALMDFIYDKTSADKYLDALKYEREILCFLQQTEDCQEGLKAMIEERTATFQAK